MDIAIDFDNTIRPCSWKEQDVGPQPECVEVIQKLKLNGHRIYLYSCRSNPEILDNYVEATQNMIEYCKKYNIPFDGVFYNKPLFDMVIDDRNFDTQLTENMSVSWKYVKERLNL